MNHVENTFSVDKKCYVFGSKEIQIVHLKFLLHQVQVIGNFAAFTTNNPTSFFLAQAVEDLF